MINTKYNSKKFNNFRNEYNWIELDASNIYPIINF